MMGGTLLFDPLVPLFVLLSLALVFFALLVFAMMRRLSGCPWRGFAAICVILALLNPSVKTEDRHPDTDIVIVVVDRSSSQNLAKRPDQNAAALAHLTRALEMRPNTQMHLVEVSDAQGVGGSLVVSVLAQALAEEPQDRVAGVIIISDGQIHDVELVLNLDVPLHLLLTGDPEDWDRRLMVKNAPDPRCCQISTNYAKFSHRGGAHPIQATPAGGREVH